MLDRTSGKTQSDIFLEFTTVADAERFAQRKTGKTLGTRSVSIELVSSKEMLDAIFPRVRDNIWVTPEEIQNVLAHAKTFKSPYTRKCPQRPFENFISILALFPWANRAVYADTQVSLLYAAYATIVSILLWHIRKGRISGLDTSLLRRLVIAGTNLTDFTPYQKKGVCSLAGFYPETNTSDTAIDLADLRGVSKHGRGSASTLGDRTYGQMPATMPQSEIGQNMVMRWPTDLPCMEITNHEKTFGGHQTKSEKASCLASPCAVLTQYAPAYNTDTKMHSNVGIDPAALASSLRQLSPIRAAGVHSSRSQLASLSSSSRAVAADDKDQQLFGSCIGVDSNEPRLALSDQWLLNARNAGIVVTSAAQ